MVCEVDATVEEVHKALRKTMATVRSAKFAAGGAKGASPLVKSLLVLAKARGAEDAAVPALLDAITYITKVGALPQHPATAAPRCSPAAAARPPPPLAASQEGAVGLTARAPPARRTSRVWRWSCASRTASPSSAASPPPRAGGPPSSPLGDPAPRRPFQKKNSTLRTMSLVLKRPRRPRAWARLRAGLLRRLAPGALTRALPAASFECLAAVSAAPVRAPATPPAPLSRSSCRKASCCVQRASPLFVHR